MFEVLTFYASLIGLFVWLVLSDTLADWRRWFRFHRVKAVLRTLEGKEVARAEAAFGPAQEVVSGSEGRRLYVWKSPAALPPAATLLIITVTVDGGGIVTHAGWEER